MVYLARVIPAFVMYCVNDVSSSSLLIESTDSMIIICKIKDTNPETWDRILNLAALTMIILSEDKRSQIDNKL